MVNTKQGASLDFLGHDEAKPEKQQHNRDDEYSDGVGLDHVMLVTPLLANDAADGHNDWEMFCKHETCVELTDEVLHE